MEAKSTDPKWNVVYTRPKSEKRVASSISEMGIESYLPLHKVVKQWSDRRKKMEVPLFPNYVFVKVDASKRGYLYSIKELVRFVSIEKKPVVVCEKEILAIKHVLSEDLEVVSEEYFQQGMKIKIKQGQFQGLEGVVIKKYGDMRLLVKIDCLKKAYSFNVPAKLAEPLLQN
jgi:transcription antitermination factor NusG